MRQKRRKPDRSRLSGRSGFGNPGNAGEFGRQIDADLTQASEDDPDCSQLSTLDSTTVDLPGSDISGGDKPGGDLSGDNRPGADFSKHHFDGADLPAIGEQGVSSTAARPSATQPVTIAIVRDRAVRLLCNREHGRKELEQKLLQRDLPSDLIVSVLDQLVQEGLQCDARFAESYTRMRIDRGYGANKIRADLQTRRLEQAVIEEAISDCGADWTGVAGGALIKKFSSLSSADTKTRAKMQRFLYQRGFAAEEIRSAMNNYQMADSEF